MLNWPKCVSFTVNGLFILILPLAAFDLGRDFSGKWFLDAAAVVPARFFRPRSNPDRNAADQAVQCAARMRTGQPFAGRICSMERKPAKHPPTGPRKARLRNGRAPRCSSTRYFRRAADYTVMDRWNAHEWRYNAYDHAADARAGKVKPRVRWSTRTSRSPVPPSRPRAGPRPAVRRASARNCAAHTQPTPGIHRPRRHRGTHIGLGAAQRARHQALARGRPRLSRNHSANRRSVGGSSFRATVTSMAQSPRASLPRVSRRKGEMYIRFDSIVLPNGVSRDFRSRLVSADASARGKVDTKEGSVTGERDSSGDSRTVATEAGLALESGRLPGRLPVIL